MLVNAAGYSFDLITCQIPALKRHAHRWFPSCGVGDDLVQEALQSALKVWEDWTPSDPSNPARSAGGWIYILLRNKMSYFAESRYWTDFKRGEQRLKYVSERNCANKKEERNKEFIMNEMNDLCETPVLTSNPLETMSFSDLVEQAINRLPKDWQKIVRLYAEGVTQPEISRITGVKTSTVSTRLVRAFDLMRPILATHAANSGIRSARAWQDAFRREAA